ncbi:hypothetical protein [Methylobacterium fujisawaense]|uniref:hypothetical protein n=1 Tax=Methylobacterium fujisawaense TaxID=107400 RepID=UPI00313DBBF8
MSDLHQIRSDMADAEHRIRTALAAETPARRLDAVMSAYWATPHDKQDTFVAALAANLTLRRPRLVEVR